MTADDDAPTKRPRHRSRITRGTKLLPNVHEQSVWARIMRDVFDACLAHLGGEDNASELLKMQCRRIAALEAELIHLEDKIAQARAAGEEPAPATVDLYCRLGNAQRRHCEALGWTRVPKDITGPSLAQYFELKARKVTEVEDIDG